ncbi:HAD-IIIA family hydrolase [Saccharibacillus alkalitolerans]|uniref:D,D-heptose 1,7-bisphosphate phosphatase n=1 Tax=Saccharibacillus alkalitolerans TaxID=2705290 RepID=A0ABX0FCD7_9BACL|nr:HAD-IIIA family hydrolase [Saccharibacillus alkalitolerans]NGZ77670.1 HAD-IIIA family hydrolase [Saccharibacillus alkalitolerans]
MIIKAARSRAALEEVQAVFLDRDGTLGGNDQMILPGEFECFPSVPESIDALKAAGKRIFSFTNQPVIARGQAKLEEFERELTAFGFDGVYVCPHEHGEGCACRKPAVGMLEQAADEHDLDLRKCAVVGDRWTDMVAAKKAGCLGILVLTGAGRGELERYRGGDFSEEWRAAYPEHTAENLNEAIRWLLNAKGALT